MEVILLEKVQRLGGLGDKVSVKAGYARNFLIPKGIAVAATPKNLVEFEARREELERREAEALAAAGNRAAGLDGVEITVFRKAGESGRLFGSVGPADVALALTESGHEISRQEVRMPDGETIRQVGEYDVTIHVSAGVDASIRLKVEPEPAGQ
ncbi:MAG: 50S ribosomal protein L9 [Gammaproteobacteria bacterium]|nr:50S ribosomal protein L9 [Gammaproteobacteria bacterium]